MAGPRAAAQPPLEAESGAGSKTLSCEVLQTVTVTLVPVQTRGQDHPRTNRFTRERGRSAIGQRQLQGHELAERSRSLRTTTDREGGTPPNSHKATWIALPPTDILWPKSRRPS